MTTTMLLSFSIYLMLVVVVGIVAYRVTSNLSDFVLGGRRLGGAVAALSAGASDMSAWLLLGLPGAVFVSGLNQLWLPVGLLIGAYINWRYIARPLRVYTEHANDSLTIPSFLEHRFATNGKRIRALSAIATLIFFTFYSASGLVGGALLMESTFPMLNYTEGLVIGTAIIVGYTFVGGFLAVSWTDFFQGIFMFMCLLAIPLIASQPFGGFGSALGVIEAAHPTTLNPLHGFSLFTTINLLAWGLGYFGQPHILVRFMAVSSTKEIPLARRIGISWMFLSLLGAMLVGLVGLLYFPTEGGFNPESVFIIFSNQMFEPWLAGLVLAAILSSIMCALDSQLLAASSALTEDIYHAFLRPHASRHEQVFVARMTVIVTASAAMFLALTPNKSILDLVAFAWAGLGATFGPSIIATLFWRNVTARGVFWSMAVGMLTVIMFHLFNSPVYEIIPGYILGTITLIVVSKATANHPDELALFDKVKRLLKEGV